MVSMLTPKCHVNVNFIILQWSVLLLIWKDLPLLSQDSMAEMRAP